MNNNVINAPCDMNVDVDVVSKAALLSENIVKIVMMEESYKSLASIPGGENLDSDLWNHSSITENTLPTTSSTISTTSQPLSNGSSTSPITAPAAYLMQALGRMTPEGCAPCSIMALENRDLFHKCTPEQMDHFDNDVLGAIHNKDIDTLRAWHAEGRPLQTSSPFGDTLLHVACRRGYLDVVTFLVKEASVSLWVQDEQGRTPLHFGCHSAEPWFDLVDFIIQQDPDLLFVADARGSMPLDYAPKETWGDWITFLNEKELRSVMPRRRVFFTRTERRTTPLHALPFLEDIDRIISDYMAQKKKKKKSKARRRESASSNEDATPQTMRKKIASAILQQLYADNEDSFSSLANLEAMQDLVSLSPDELLEGITLQRSLNRKIGSQPPQVLLSPPKSSSELSNSSGSERIDLIKECQELRIKHVMASTSFEIASEMERQAINDLDLSRREVQGARKESDELTSAIQELEASTASSKGSQRIVYLKQLQDLKISHVTLSSTIEIAGELERNARENLHRAQSEVHEAKNECERLTVAIQQVQNKLDFSSRG
ncbi:hypothetical protein MHU86_16213 [Fragilaria crotonensis]|nr:hypothetical protein MHU86_16213 [Fragilaria crotonensis]